MKNIAVLLNRVFRLKDNPLLNEILETKDHYDKIFLVILKEDLSDASAVKKTFYMGTFERFLNGLHEHDIKPHVMTYTDFFTFTETEHINSVLMAADIMSYHHQSYDAPSMKKSLNKQNIDVQFMKVNHYFTPSHTFKRDHTPYKVFTPFYRGNRGKVNMMHRLSYDINVLATIIFASKENYTFTHLSEGMGEAEALETWQTFLNVGIEHYNENREYLSEVRTSTLSISLSHGLLDIKMIINQLLSRLDNNEAEFESFIREIMFREFYYALMTEFPETAETSFNKKYKDIEWSANEDFFNRWKHGETGYPIVDAAMQELKATGFMHNRCRMIVSQFLTKDLLIDWRWGEDYFRKQLIDYDNASNVHGWQWSASTGSDAVPYFRMFNPVRQSERFLGNGEYVRKFLPIFKDVPVKYMHEPVKYAYALKVDFNITLGEDYPYFIVDHKTQRAYVIELFQQYQNG